MTIISQLKLSEKTRTQMLTFPELRSRQNLIMPIDNQIAAVAADQTGEPLNLKAMRWIDVPETGQRVRKEVPVRVRRWWWKDEAGQVMLDVRYGNKRMELAPKKPTIEVGSMDQMLPTLEQVREAVVAGELDKAIAASSVWSKRSVA